MEDSAGFHSIEEAVQDPENKNQIFVSDYLICFGKLVIKSFYQLTSLTLIFGQVFEFSKLLGFAFCTLVEVAKDVVGILCNSHTRQTEIWVSNAQAAHLHVIERVS